MTHRGNRYNPGCRRFEKLRHNEVSEEEVTDMVNSELHFEAVNGLLIWGAHLYKDAINKVTLGGILEESYIRDRHSG